MTSWRKRIEGGGGADLHPGERLVAGVFLQPDGTTGSLMAKELGGVVGGAVAARRRATPATPAGIAAVLPDERLWLGLTDQRLLVWKHGMMRGRPAGLRTELPAGDLVHVELVKRKTTHGVTLTFSDGSVSRHEAPRMMNDPDDFARVVNQR